MQGMMWNLVMVSDCDDDVCLYMREIGTRSWREFTDAILEVSVPPRDVIWGNILIIRVVVKVTDVSRVLNLWNMTKYNYINQLC